MKEMPWRDMKLTKDQRITFLELELSLRNELLAVLEANEAAREKTDEVFREIDARRDDFQALLGRSIKAVIETIRKGQAQEAVEALEILSDILKPTKPLKAMPI